MVCRFHAPINPHHCCSVTTAACITITTTSRGVSSPAASSGLGSSGRCVYTDQASRVCVAPRVWGETPVPLPPTTIPSDHTRYNWPLSSRAACWLVTYSLPLVAAVAAPPGLQQRNCSLQFFSRAYSRVCTAQCHHSRRDTTDYSNDNMRPHPQSSQNKLLRLFISSFYVYWVSLYILTAKLSNFQSK